MGLTPMVSMLEAPVPPSGHLNHVCSEGLPWILADRKSSYLIAIGAYNWLRRLINSAGELQNEILMRCWKIVAILSNHFLISLLAVTRR